MKEYKYRAYDPTGLLKAGISKAPSKKELTKQLKTFGFSDIVIIDADMELPVKRFRYFAREASGEIIDGVTEAANEKELISQLEQLGLSDISLEEESPEDDEYDERLRRESIRVRQRRRRVENAIIMALGVLAVAASSILVYKWTTRPKMPMPEFHRRAQIKGLEFTNLKFDGTRLVFTAQCETAHKSVALAFKGYDGFNQLVDEGEKRIGQLGSYYERTEKTVSFELNQNSYFDYIEIYAYSTEKR